MIPSTAIHSTFESILSFVTHRFLISALTILTVTGCDTSDNEKLTANKISGLETAQFDLVLKCKSETSQLINLGVIHLLLEKNPAGHVVAIWSHSRDSKVRGWRRDAVSTDINYIYWENSRIDQKTFALQNAVWDSNLTCHTQTLTEFTKEWMSQ